MKFKTTGFLLATCCALGAYLYFVDQPKQQASRAAREREGELFGAWDPARATELSAQGPLGKLRVRKGGGGKWAVVEPVADAADEGKIRSLLDELKALKAEKEVGGAKADRKPFGLDQPAFTIDLGGRAGTLAIGAETPSGEGRYVQKGGGPVQVVNSSAAAGLLVKPDDLRSKEVVEGFPWDRLRSVEVAGAATLRLAKVQGKWRVEAPAAFEADPDAAEAMTEKLRWGRIKSFSAAGVAAAERRLAKGVTVTLTADAGAPPAVVRLAEVDGAVVGVTQGRSAVYVLEKEVLAALRRPPDELRRRKPVLTKTWSAEKLELSAPGRTAAYEKVEGAWRSRGATLGAEERDALTALLQVLEEEKAHQVVAAPGPAAAYGLDAPAATLRLSDSQTGAQVVVLGKKGALHYARSGGEGPVYVVGPGFLSRAVELLKQSGRAAPGRP